jgi:diacylglycerol kinase
MFSPDPTRRTWAAKFADSFRGSWEGVRGQSSFRVHAVVAVLVLAAAAGFQVAAWEWCVLILCITAVFVSELFNSALERLAKAVDHQHNPLIGAALDIASAAVLWAALGAAAAGLVILGPHAWSWLRGGGQF